MVLKGLYSLYTLITSGVKTLDEVCVHNVQSHRKIEIEGTEIFHFEKDKIKEG
jgi:hypothetical protein